MATAYSRAYAFLEQLTQHRFIALELPGTTVHIGNASRGCALHFTFCAAILPRQIYHGNTETLYPRTAPRDQVHAVFHAINVQ